MMSPPYIGRFAPSPTGPLHLGSLATALGSYLDARVHGGKWLLRIEDIDEQRCTEQAKQHIIQTLQIHGLLWDGAPVIQTQRTNAYREALNLLSAQNLCYPCACTRKEIEAANTERQAGVSRIYPGTCAHGMPIHRPARAIRFRCPQQAIAWPDNRLGLFTENLSETSGDFVLLRGDGFWAYHLAVVVDDATSHVTHIVRGEDLTETTARQIAVYQALNSNAPHYWHLPVILAEDGQKLSKQTGAQAVNHANPVGNLNSVWKHFGLEPIQTGQPEQWLKLALPQWKKYRAANQYKP